MISPPILTAPSKLKDDCFALPPGVHWTPVDEALNRLHQQLTCVVGREMLDIAAASGRILAEAVVAGRSNPPTANSAVDGYGVAFASLGSSAHSLPLVKGRSAAGQPYEGAVPAGHAVRVLTGAAIPMGVDTVIMQEDVRLDGGQVHFLPGIKVGANARRAGEDVLAGAEILAAGRRLSPHDLALLAAVGTGKVQVYKTLRVGVLSTGDELVTPGQGASDSQIYDANRPMMLAMLQRWGFSAVDLGHVGDDRAALRQRLDSAASKVDAIVTSGGASAGDEDHMSSILAEEGKVQSWRIALKPGRPLALGLWQGVPVFGLPGNPVAAFVCALIFARPALGLLGGADWQTPQGFQVPAGFAKSKKAGRREYLRARINAHGQVEAYASEGSGRISGLSWADGLVELGDDAQDITLGDLVTYYPFGAFGL